LYFFPTTSNDEEGVGSQLNCCALGYFCPDPPPQPLHYGRAFRVGRIIPHYIIHYFIFKQTLELQKVTLDLDAEEREITLSDASADLLQSADRTLLSGRGT
jgi:hypothetical protein